MERCRRHEGNEGRSGKQEANDGIGTRNAPASHRPREATDTARYGSRIKDGIENGDHKDERYAKRNPLCQQADGHFAHQHKKRGEQHVWRQAGKLISVRGDQRECEEDQDQHLGAGIKLVEGLTLESIQNTAQRYLDVDNYVQVTLYPEDFD